MQWLLSWLLLAVAFLVTARVVSGIHIPRFRDAVIVAAIFGVLDAVVGKILFFLIVVGTMGLGLVLALITHWIVTAIMLKLSARLSGRLSIDGFGAALKGAAVLTVVSAIGRFALGIIG